MGSEKSATEPRSITDDDLVRVANENYQAGRKHGKEELRGNGRAIY